MKLTPEQEKFEQHIQEDMYEAMSKLFVDKCNEHGKPEVVFEGMFYGWMVLALEVKVTQPKFWNSFINNVWDKMTLIIKAEDSDAMKKQILDELDNDSTRN